MRLCTLWVPLAMEVVWVWHVSVHEDDGVLCCIVPARMMRHAALCVKRRCTILVHQRQDIPLKTSLIAAQI